MEKSERQMKQDENTINDIAEKLELVSNTNIVKKEELLHKLIGNDVVEAIMINFAGQIFIKDEKI